MQWILLALTICQTLLTISISVFFLNKICNIASNFLSDKIIIDRKKMLYEEYIKIIDSVGTAKELAYKKIYQTDVLPMSSSGYRFSKSELTEIQQRYVKLVIKLLGPEMFTDLLQIFGDERSIYLNFLYSFIFKLVEDEAKILEDVEENAEDEKSLAPSDFNVE